MKNLSVMVVARDGLVRLGLRTALGQNAVSIVSEAAGPLDAICKASRLQPDVILLALGGAGANELTAVREIARSASQARVVLVSDRDEETHVEEALMSGASAYLLKETAATDLPWAMRALQKGREYFSPTLVQRLRAPSSTVVEPEQHEALLEPPVSPVENLLGRMINTAVLIRQLASELSANIKLLRKLHPDLLRKLWGARLPRSRSLIFVRRLLVRYS